MFPNYETGPDCKLFVFLFTKKYEILPYRKTNSFKLYSEIGYDMYDF